jgi:hypothetical protein
MTAQLDVSVVIIREIKAESRLNIQAKAYYKNAAVRVGTGRTAGF